MTGIICLVLSLGLLFFSLYIIPFLLWNLSYNVPDFLLQSISFFEDDQGYSYSTSRFIVWLCIFIPGLITGYVSYIISHYIEKIRLNPPIPEEEGKPLSSTEIVKPSKAKGTDLTVLKIVALMVGIFFLMLLLQLFFRTTA